MWCKWGTTTRMFSLVVLPLLLQILLRVQNQSRHLLGQRVGIPVLENSAQQKLGLQLPINIIKILDSFIPFLNSNQGIVKMFVIKTFYILFSKKL